MKQGFNAIDFVGMPQSHGQAVQRVAEDSKCVIAVRAVGKWARGLLEESYATKGFHNKAKSCDWGPMAGFVLSDPRFSKNPDLEDQREELQKARQKGATEAPLHISERRRQDLERAPLNCMVRAGGTDEEPLYTARRPGNPRSMRFVLRPRRGVPGTVSDQVLWAVCYAPGEERLSFDLAGASRSIAGEPLPVMAIVDRDCPAHLRNTWRAATTADYDLWAVFPRRGVYARQREDARAVPGSDRFPLPLAEYIRHEPPDFGNLTQRIAGIRTAINRRVANEAGYRGGDVVRHSDEAGRPEITRIDFPFIAFVPRGLRHPHAPYGIENAEQLRLLIGRLDYEYVVTLNPGWQQELGIGASAGGNWVVM